MNLQPEEKENRSFCIKWISTHGCAFKAFLKKVNTGEKKEKESYGCTVKLYFTGTFQERKKPGF